jgi:hypothetical protein
MVQKALLTKLNSLIESIPSVFLSIIGVPRIFDILRLYYWYVEENDISEGVNQVCNPLTKEVLGKRPDIEDVKDIRIELFRMIDLMTENGNNLVQSDLNFIISSLTGMFFK